MLDDAGWIRVEVQDSGQWKPSEGSVDRGLGLTLMRSLMDTVEVSPGSVGTTIVMERRVELPAVV
jgi:anti-sigma regulatory factor (Ser/Thr protein kinase)